MTKEQRLTRILEAVLPYVEYAAVKGLPNAELYHEQISRILWRPERRA